MSDGTAAAPRRRRRISATAVAFIRDRGCVSGEEIFLGMAEAVSRPTSPIEVRSYIIKEGATMYYQPHNVAGAFCTKEHYDSLSDKEKSIWKLVTKRARKAR